jgi:glycosyltransferase involved in cell wall biosynthesis
MSTASDGASPTTIRVAQIIARLNVGGPAIQAILLTRLLDPLGYRTRLLRGREGPEEGSVDYLADELFVQPVLIRSLRRDPGLHDLPALLALVRELRRTRPQIIHTHAAKAGTLGRLSALIALRRHQRVLVHTFHGHSLTGYFNPRTARLYTIIERILARRTDALIAISEEVRDELASLGVAPADRFTIVPLGVDLGPFAVEGPKRDTMRRELRRELGIPDETKVVTLVARLVPIKRVDRFLRMARLITERTAAHFVIAGDGELGTELRACTDARALGERVSWIGFRRDMPAVCFASDVVALTSDNEGTPMSLIEAQASGVPVVATDVGGVRSVVHDGHTGIVRHPDDDSALAQAVVDILTDDVFAKRLAAAGRTHALSAFSIERLVEDLDRLYSDLLQTKRR